MEEKEGKRGGQGGQEERRRLLLKTNSCCQLSIADQVKNKKMIHSCPDKKLEKENPVSNQTG